MRYLDVLQNNLPMFVDKLNGQNDYYTVNASVSEVQMNFRDWKFLARPRVVCEDDKLAYELSFSTIVGLKLATMGRYMFKVMAGSPVLITQRCKQAASR